MRKFTEFIVIWETITRRGCSYRYYQRTFDSLEAAERCYFSKRRTQFARLFKKENNDVTLIRENGK